MRFRNLTAVENETILRRRPAISNYTAISDMFKWYFYKLSITNRRTSSEQIESYYCTCPQTGTCVSKCPFSTIALTIKRSQFYLINLNVLFTKNIKGLRSQHSKIKLLRKIKRNKIMM